MIDKHDNWDDIFYVPASTATITSNSNSFFDLKPKISLKESEFRTKEELLLDEAIQEAKTAIEFAKVINMKPIFFESKTRRRFNLWSLDFYYTYQIKIIFVTNEDIKEKKEKKNGNTTCSRAEKKI